MKKLPFLIAATVVGLCLDLVPARGQSIATVAPASTNWQSSAAAGLTLTRGNSDTLLGTLSASADKKWGADELSLGADGTYGETKINGVNTKNAESAHGFGQFNRLFSERLYGFGRVGALHDGVADIRYRVTLSPGAGYYLIKHKTTDLSVELGPGFVYQDLGGVTRGYATLRVAEKFHYAISAHARLWEAAEFLPQVDNFNNYIINTEIGIETDLTKKLSLRSYLDDTYNNVPAAGRLKNDAKLVTAVAYKF